MRWSSRQMEIFIAVVEEGGFSAAGERLNMVQPAVSIAVKRLEEAARVQLLNRSNQGVSPTKEGETFLSYARLILRHMAELGTQLQDLQSLAAGHVTIGAPSVTMAYVVPKLTAEFLALYPALKLRASIGPSETVINRVRMREVDVGFIPGGFVADDLEQHLIWDVPLMCCTSETSPLAGQSSISWRALLEHPLAIFPRGYNQRTQIDRVAQSLGIALNIHSESESAELLMEMVRAGQALSITFAQAAAMASGVVSIPIDDGPTVPISICRRKDHSQSVAANAFYEHVLARVAQAASA